MRYCSAREFCECGRASMSSRQVSAGRSAVLAAVALAIVASTGEAAGAVPSTGLARAFIAAGTAAAGTAAAGTAAAGTAASGTAASGAASSGTASSALAARDSSPAAVCPPAFDVCKRSIQHVLKIPVVFSGNTAGCRFSWDIHWGDRSMGTHVTKVSPPPGTELLARHTYQRQGTFTVMINANVTAGGCTTTGATWQFELLADVALGDSYAAGDGAGAYLTRTGFTGNECLRSRNAYPVLVDADLGNPRPAKGGPTFVFRACTGAVIGSFTSDQVTENHAQVGRQLDYVGVPVVGRVGLVTLSIGGTDTLLDAVMSYCAQRSSGQESCENHSKVAVNAVLSTIEPQLKTLFAHVKGGTALAPGARVLVLGYPALFRARPTRSCPTGWHRDTFQPSDMAWINSAIQALDAKIAKAAAAASVTYVNAYGALANHELCSSVPYLHDVVLAHRQIESFHPTIGGQKILAALIEKALKLS